MGELTYCDGMDRLDTDPDAFADWTFRVGGFSDSTRTLLATRDGGDDVARLAVGNFVWQTRTLASKSGMRQQETRRGRVAALRECRPGEFLALVDYGDTLARVDARAIVADLATDRETWATDPPEAMPRGDRRMTRWVDVTAQSAVPDPDSTGDLTFEKIDGRGSRKTVNAFLEGHEDGLVDHACGGVHHWKAAFVARCEGRILGAIVLAPPQNGTLAAAGEEIVISRIACHPNRPQNTSTWLIARARKWAERAGYARISSLAGVDGNRGGCYKGAGFTLDTEVADYQDASGDVWHKRRYVDELTPETYEGRDVPMPGEGEVDAEQAVA